FIGGALAVAVLLVFLRSIPATIVVATAIPISILGSFIVLNALGRNLNVVSLAGISFAVGMLVDNAIVVLENIDRHKKMGKAPFEAAYDGAKEVWGAVLASTVTTVAVFLPVVFIQEEAGQLFRDIAIAITTSVTLSLAVSVLVIPMLSKQLYTLAGEAKAVTKENIIVRAGGRLAGLIMALVNAAIRSTGTRVLTAAALTVFAVLSAFLLFPKMEYLPQGNRNLVINILVPPPGLSYGERKDIGEQIFGMAAPYIGKETHEGLPGVRNMFYVGSDQIMLFGAISTQEQQAGRLLPLFTRFIFSIPGMFGISNQAGIFQTNLGRGRTIDVDITGEDINRAVQAGGMMFGMVKQRIPEAQIRPIPSLELLYPEVRIIPRRERLKAAGMSAEDLGVALDVMMDGRRIGDFNEVGEKKIDLVLMASKKRVETPEELYEAPIVTASGEIVPVSSLSSLVRTYGIPQIRHLERQRTV
ncbi:MAG: efflux RND transporter permease subunit, partial [Deltaproteobacteria bacterium]|nr:efflux RND transporter permease subunit [Deltaproteobacteria bacterium]